MWYTIKSILFEITVYATLAGITIGICALVGANLYDLCH